MFDGQSGAPTTDFGIDRRPYDRPRPLSPTVLGLSVQKPNPAFLKWVMEFPGIPGTSRRKSENRAQTPWCTPKGPTTHHGEKQEFKAGKKTQGRGNKSYAVLRGGCWGGHAPLKADRPVGCKSRLRFVGVMLVDLAHPSSLCHTDMCTSCTCTSCTRTCSYVLLHVRTCSYT